LVGLTCVIFSIQDVTLSGEGKQGCLESCNIYRQQERLGDHCYQWSTDSKTWDNSELHCNSKNGHLAAVTSSEIHNFLSRKVDTSERKTWYWIGGSDKTQEGKWEWTDGSVWDFKLWADQPFKQPSTSWLGQNCLQIYNHYFAKNGWNDQKCDGEYRFICSWRICSASTSPPPSTTETAPETSDTGSANTTETTTHANITEPATNETTTWNDKVFNIMGVEVPLLAVILVPGGVLLMLVTVVVCIACKRSKKKKENMEVEENPVYQTYELGENYERQYSINEVIDHNPDYA